MNEFANQTLAQIVTGNHRTAAVFEKYRLDFCCKGKRSLQQACVEQNIAVDQLVNELETVSGTSTGSCQVQFPFNKLTLSQLADYIVSTHHEYVKRELPQVFAYVQKVASKHGERHPELYRIFDLVGAIEEEMSQHMQKEEQVLFPRIKEIEKLSHQDPTASKPDFTYLQSPIAIMEQEHEHAGAMMQEISQLTNDYTPPQDACTTYKLSFAALKAFEMNLHQHVHLENNILFPKALQLFRHQASCSLN